MAVSCSVNVLSFVSASATSGVGAGVGADIVGAAVVGDGFTALDRPQLVPKRRANTAARERKRITRVQVSKPRELIAFSTEYVKVSI